MDNKITMRSFVVSLCPEAGGCVSEGSGRENYCDVPEVYYPRYVVTVDSLA